MNRITFCLVHHNLTTKNNFEKAEISLYFGSRPRKVQAQITLI